MVRLLRALAADHVEHALLPLAHRALGLAAEVARRPAEVLRGTFEEGPTVGERAPRRLGPLGGRLGVLEQQRLEAALDGDGHPLDLGRLALDGADQPVADPADLGLQGAQQLSGADELLPPREHLTAQEGAVGTGVVDRAHAVCVGPFGVLAQRGGRGDLLVERVGDEVGAP